MEEYKRLTKKADVNLLDCEYSCGSLHLEVVKRLGELEDKIENGTLIELPCAINNIVYQVCEKPNNNPFVKLTNEFFIIQHKIGDIKMSMIGTKPIFRILTLNNELGIMAWSGEHIGTQLFLTEAEAEAKLKELQSND